MRCFSFPSVFIAILTSNLILILLAVFLSRQKTYLNFSLKCLGCFFLFAVSRSLFPFELPITTNICFPESVSRVLSDFLHPHFTAGRYEFSLWSIFVVIWFLGFIRLLFQFLCRRREFRRFIQSNGRKAAYGEREQIWLSRLQEQEKKKQNICLYWLSAIRTPMVCRFHSQYWILLPECLHLSEQEFSFVIKHELAHIRHHDLTLKFIIHFLCMFYWWNPLNRFLKKQADLLLELRVDDTVAGSEEETAEYLECLLKIAAAPANELLSPVAIAFCADRQPLLVKRFEMLIHRGMSRRDIRAFLLKGLPVAICFLLYIGSFVFIFEPSYIPPEVKQSTFTLTDENAYAIETIHGSYDLYLYHQYIETVDSLEYYSDSLPVYFEKMEESLDEY